MNWIKHRRSRFVALHLLGSLVVAGLAALVVFAVWYPPPYAAIAGGIGLFSILVAVDVVLGPLLTAVVANPNKPTNSLRRDEALIVAVQLAGLAFGLHAIAEARPVHLSFEVDRFRVVTAADIEPEALRDAQPGLRELPWSGPTLIAAAKPTQPDEVLRSVELAMSGFDISMFPRNWRDYASFSTAAWNAARPLSMLSAQYPAASPEIADIAFRAAQPIDALRFLPLLSRHQNWVAVIAQPGAKIVGYLPLEGFF